MKQENKRIAGQSACRCGTGEYLVVVSNEYYKQSGLNRLVKIFNTIFNLVKTDDEKLPLVTLKQPWNSEVNRRIGGLLSTNL